MTTLRPSLLTSAIASIGSLASFSTFAQSATQAYSCVINLEYRPLVSVIPPITTPNPPDPSTPIPPVEVPLSALAVPGLDVVGVCVLAGLVGYVAWRKRKSGGFRALSVVLMMGAAGLATQGGDGWIQAVRAANPFNMDIPSGGTVARTVNGADIPTPQTIVNNTDVRMKIISNANNRETAAGTCAVDAEIAPGESCTTQAVCTAVQVLSVQQEPTAGCDTSTTTQRLAPYVSTTDPTQASYVTYSAYEPVLLGTAEFDPLTSPEPTVELVSFIPEVENWAPNAARTDLETGNWEAVGRGTATITATAPAGYVFAPSLAPTYTWQSTYQDCSQRVGTTSN